MRPPTRPRRIASLTLPALLPALLLTGCTRSDPVAANIALRFPVQILSLQLALGSILALLTVVIGASALILMLLTLRSIRRGRAVPQIPLVTGAVLLAALVLVAAASLLLLASPGPVTAFMR